MKDNRSGLTLVEVLIFIAMIGLIASIAIPCFVKAKALQAQHEASLAEQPTSEQLTEQAKLESEKRTQSKLAQVRFFEPDAYYFPFPSMKEFLEVRGAFLDAHTNLESVCVEPDVVRIDSRGEIALSPRDVFSSYGVGVTIGHTMFVREKR